MRESSTICSTLGDWRRILALGGWHPNCGVHGALRGRSRPGLCVPSSQPGRLQDACVCRKKKKETRPVDDKRQPDRFRRNATRHAKSIAEIPVSRQHRPSRCARKRWPTMPPNEWPALPPLGPVPGQCRARNPHLNRPCLLHSGAPRAPTPRPIQPPDRCTLFAFRHGTRRPRIVPPFPTGPPPHLGATQERLQLDASRPSRPLALAGGVMDTCSRLQHPKTDWTRRDPSMRHTVKLKDHAHKPQFPGRAGARLTCRCRGERFVSNIGTWQEGHARLAAEMDGNREEVPPRTLHSSTHRHLSLKLPSAISTAQGWAGRISISRRR